MKFTHKTILQTTIAAFDDKELSVRTKSILAGEKIRTVRLDEIRHSYDFSTTFNGAGLLTAFAVATLFIYLFSSAAPFINFGGAFIPLLIAVIFLPFFFNYYNYYELKAKGEPIILRCSKKKKAEAEDFLTLLIDASKLYVKNKYGFADADIPKDVQFQNYRWLLQNSIISEEEYEDMKKNLKAL
ncbi:MAG: hypothetical protein ACI85O_001600 [Saprospiraceae bacterium]|jgi:hypothetical protein